jgi:hypothetical protein
MPFTYPFCFWAKISQIATKIHARLKMHLKIRGINAKNKPKNGMAANNDSQCDVWSL